MIAINTNIPMSSTLRVPNSRAPRAASTAANVVEAQPISLAPGRTAGWSTGGEGEREGEREGDGAGADGGEGDAGR